MNGIIAFRPLGYLGKSFL